MQKKLSATEAKINLGAVLDWVRQHAEGVVIERRGRPEAVVISFETYEALQAAGEARRREDAWEKLEAAAERVRERNWDLAPEEADALAEEVSRETVERLIAERRARYEG